MQADRLSVPSQGTPSIYREQSKGFPPELDRPFHRLARSSNVTSPDTLSDYINGRNSGTSNGTHLSVPVPQSTIDYDSQRTSRDRASFNHSHIGTPDLPGGFAPRSHIYHIHHMGTLSPSPHPHHHSRSHTLSPPLDPSLPSNLQGNIKPLFGALLQTPSLSQNALSMPTPPAWPENLPPAPIVRHLVETFFNTIQLAPHLIHRPTFTSSLTLPPKDPGFPSVALLHAICAVTTLYAPLTIRQALAAAAPRPSSSSSDRSSGGWGATGSPSRDAEVNAQITAFADEHAELARNLAHLDVRHSKRMLESVQSTIILGWYNVCKRICFPRPRY